MRLLRRLRRLLNPNPDRASRKPPGPGDYSALVEGFYLVPILAILGELGIADALLEGRPFSVADFASGHGLNAEILGSCADYLSLKGILQADGDRWRPTEKGRDALARWHVAMLHFAYAPLTGSLLGLVRGEKQYGPEGDVYRSMYLDARASGVGGLRSGRFERVIAWLGQNGCRGLADLGCGDATFLTLACQRLENLRAVGIDRSEAALASARENLDRDGLRDRCLLRHGDLEDPGAFMKWDAMHEVDFVSAWFVLHELTYESVQPVRHFLDQFKAHVGAARLGVTEVYRLDPQDRVRYSSGAVAETTLFHDLSRQRLLSREQWIELYHECGFRVVDAISHIAVPGAPPALETLVLEAPGAGSSV